MASLVGAELQDRGRVVGPGMIRSRPGCPDTGSYPHTAAMRGGAPTDDSDDDTTDVVIVVAHDALRTLLVEHVARRRPSWRIHASADSREALASLEGRPPDLAIVAAGDVARCCRATFDALPPERVIVIVPEPDPAYQGAARDAGLAGSLPADRLSDDLLPLAVRALGALRGGAPVAG